MNKNIEKINKVIDEVRSFVLIDGGFVNIKNYDSKTKILTVEVSGACVGCDLFDVTYENGLKELLLFKLPKIVSNVIFITKQ